MYTTILIGMIAGSFILYSLFYFELQPAYLCEIDGQWSTCSKDYICENEYDFMIDYTNSTSLHNWVDQYNLTCTSDIGLSMIGSSFFIGTFLGSFVLPRLADVVGRKPIFLLGLVLYIVTVVGMIFAKDVYVLYGLLVLGGISETGRYYVAYVYAVEIIPKRSQNIAGLTIFMMFAGCKVLICSYFFFSESKDWKHMAYVALTLAIYSLVATYLFLPESPKFLEGKKKFEEAFKILKRIQK